IPSSMRRFAWMIGLLVAGCAAPPHRPVAPAAPPDPDRVPFNADLRAAELRSLAQIIGDSYSHLAAKQAEWGVDLPKLLAKYEPAIRAADTWPRYELVMVAFTSEFHDVHLAWRRTRAPGEKRRRI